jgi:hypothetical protein
VFELPPEADEPFIGVLAAQPGHLDQIVAG